MVDLHLHTVASDGVLRPREVVRRAARKGLRVIAITDHDSTEGLAEALAEAEQHPGLTIIPGIELSTDIPRSEVHILGYFIDYENAGFQQTLAQFRASRYQRGERMVQKLAELGISIPWERVLHFSDGGAVGRPHVAQAMLEAGYISSVSEAFLRYIGRNGPAYVERQKMTPAEAVSLVRERSGSAVLAHPADIDEGELEPLLDDLQAVGLAGMEVHYQGYPPELVGKLLAIAKRRGLVPCGGSDYHGPHGPGELGIGEVDVPLETAHRLFALAGRRLELTA